MYINGTRVKTHSTIEITFTSPKKQKKQTPFKRKNESIHAGKVLVNPLDDKKLTFKCIQDFTLP